MLRLVTLLLLCICASACFLFSQNVVPNPGFETVVSCPTGISQFVGRVADWLPANTASPDYAACGVNGNSAIRNYPNTGNASAGMWGGSSHPFCANTAYVEGIQATLTSTITAGSSVDISFSVQVDAIGSATANPNGCVDFGVYLFNSASPPTVNGTCCFSVVPQFAVSASLIQSGTYTTFSGTITATGNYDRIILGPFCNGLTNSAACSNYLGTRMYFNVDDMVVQPATVLPTTVIEASGQSYIDWNEISWKVGDQDQIERFYIERSEEGTIFERVGEGVARTQGQSEYVYWDREAGQGTHIYRIMAESLDGGRLYSNLIELQSGWQPSDLSSQFKYGYDREAASLIIFAQGEVGDQLSLVIRDLNGKELGVYNWIAESVEHQYRIPVGNLSAGLYVLELTGFHGKVSGFNKWMKY